MIFKGLQKAMTENPTAFNFLPQNLLWYSILQWSYISNLKKCGHSTFCYDFMKKKKYIDLPNDEFIDGLYIILLKNILNPV